MAGDGCADICDTTKQKLLIREMNPANELTESEITGFPIAGYLGVSARMEANGTKEDGGAVCAGDTMEDTGVRTCWTGGKGAGRDV